MSHVQKVQIPSVNDQGTFNCPEGCNGKHQWQSPNEYYEISIKGEPKHYRFDRDIDPVQSGGHGIWHQGGMGAVGHTTADVNDDIEKNWRLGKKIQLWDKTNGAIPGAFPKLRCKPPQLSFTAHSVTWTDGDGDKHVLHYKTGIDSFWHKKYTKQFDTMNVGAMLCRYNNASDKWTCSSGNVGKEENFETEEGAGGVTRLQRAIDNAFSKNDQPLILFQQGPNVVKFIDPSHVYQGLPHKKQLSQHAQVVPHSHGTGQRKNSQVKKYDSEEKAIEPLRGPNFTPRAHEEYGDQYLFSDFNDFERINYQRDDTSYGGLGTARDFIDWTPNVDHYDRSKVFGYDGHTTSPIDYMLLSVAFVVFIAICCCIVIAASFASGYVTKWWLNKRKTQSEYETMSVANV